MHQRSIVMILCLCGVAAVGARAEEDAPVEGQVPMMRAAIFVQNRASADFAKNIDYLNDQITTHLTKKGFSIIDKDLVVSSYRESRDDEDPVRDAQKAKVDSLSLEKTEATVETVLTSASALRIAQMVGADYLVVASISSAGRENRVFKGSDSAYGTDAEATVYTLRVALKIMEGRQGGTVYGDMVTATEKVAHSKNFESDSTDIVNKLLDSAAVIIADNVSSKVGRIRDTKGDALSTVEFAIQSNVEDATVELDGAALGSAPGKFSAAPGLHQLRISREWFATWDRTVNIYSNQLLNVSLELSEEGRKRFKDTETFKMVMDKSRQDLDLQRKTTEQGLDLQRQVVEQDLALNKEVTETNLAVVMQQSDADAYAKKKIAEGEKTKREHSYIHDDGIGHEIKTIIHGD